ncbi:phasin [Bradyrhizobium sp. S3.3.6]|uniref:phasin family protein n=1 Tax=Bradyrhizobium sp. S3.3.6 TaxID=3156429 RepID=UPI00339799D8
MTDQSHEPIDLPPEMRNVAESSLKQARDAFEKLLANAEAAAGSIEERGASMRAGAKDIGARAIAFAETNVHASLNYAQSLVHAKDVAEVMRLHSEYVQAQMKALAEQASEIGQIVSRAAMDATKPKH